MIIKATKLDLEIAGAAACDSMVMDQLIEAFDQIACEHFQRDAYDAAWAFIDANGILAYLVTWGWNISIS